VAQEVFQRRDGHLAIEMGGTTSRAATGATAGPVVTLASARVSTARDPQTELVSLWRSLARRLECHSPEHVALALPGPVDRGRVAALPTLLGIKAREIDVGALAHTIWPRASIWVMNDLTAAGHAIASRGERDFCIVTLGSGIGAKLFLDGRPLLGCSGNGGEIGHWRVVSDEAIVCDCGGRGHLGALASGRGALNWVRRQAMREPGAFHRSGMGEYCNGIAEAITTHAIVAQLEAGDRWTHRATEAPAAALGQCFALLHLASGIDRFFIVGGFGTALGRAFAARIAEHAAAHSWTTGIDWQQALVLPENADGLGVRGALVRTTLVRPDRAGSVYAA